MPWCCEDETTPASEALLDRVVQGCELHLPALWVWEILNVVAVTVKRQRITPDRVREFLAQLGTLNFQIDDAPSIAYFPRLQTLASRHGLTAYDAAYLELALRLALPIATQDDDLQKAAKAEGIELL